MPLRRPPEKKLSPARQKWFWEQYNAGKIREDPKRQFTREKTRMPVYAIPSLMGTVRRFSMRKHLLAHIRRASRINRFGTQTKFETFEFQPTQILAIDKKNLRTLERVYRAPNLKQIFYGNPENCFGSPFGKQFWRKMQEKGVSLVELRVALSDAYYEIKTKSSLTPKHIFLILLTRIC